MTLSVKKAAVTLGIRFAACQFFKHRRLSRDRCFDFARVFGRFLVDEARILARLGIGNRLLELFVDFWLFVGQNGLHIDKLVGKFSLLLLVLQ